MNSLLQLSDVDVAHKRVLLREDLNVPMTSDGQVAHDARLLAALPTIRLLMEQKAATLLLSHLGRPTQGEFEQKYSLAPVAERLSQLLGVNVRLVSDWESGDVTVAPGEVVLLENVRFAVGEKENDMKLAQKLASLCDVCVMDAFAVAHRAQASTVGMIEQSSIASAGPLLAKEIAAIEQVIKAPNHPIVAIVGGSKVSTKFGLLKALLTQVDTLIVGGGIANTLLKAAGHEIGRSLSEDSFLAEAQSLIELAQSTGKQLLLPTDVAVAKALSDDAVRHECDLSEIESDDMILDVGPDSIALIAKEIAQAKTILWNGPLGVFEVPAFSTGTIETAYAVASSSGFSIAGGGDTLAAIDLANIADKVSHVSTGGGAFLEYIEHKTLPAIDALAKKSQILIKE